MLCDEAVFHFHNRVPRPCPRGFGGDRACPERSRRGGDFDLEASPVFSSYCCCGGLLGGFCCVLNPPLDGVFGLLPNPEEDEPNPLLLPKPLLLPGCPLLPF